MFVYRFILLILELKLLTLAHSKDAGQTRRDTYPDILSCLKAINDFLLTSSSPNWKEAIKLNLRIALVPKAIVVTPNDVPGIQNVMTCAMTFSWDSSCTSLRRFLVYVFWDGRHRWNSGRKHEVLQTDWGAASPNGVDIVRVGGGVSVRELTVFLLKNGGLYWPHARCTEFSFNIGTSF